MVVAAKSEGYVNNYSTIKCSQCGRFVFKNIQKPSLLATHTWKRTRIIFYRVRQAEEKPTTFINGDNLTLNDGK